MSRSKDARLCVGAGVAKGSTALRQVPNLRARGQEVSVAVLRLHKRAFRALKTGWRQGFRELGRVDVVTKPVTRPVVAAMEWEESEFVDGGLRSGRIDTERWGMEDGKVPGQGS